MINSALSATFMRDLYARMLLTRIVDRHTWRLYEQGCVGFVATAYGREAAQVGSAVCIEIGTDFTLPYYRDLGVVLTIGMTPYEVFRTYLQSHQLHDEKNTEPPQTLHWGYQKHNTVTGAAPVATQILHAAGIAFASKLRKAAVVTVAYSGDGAIAEADFLEGIRFAALHQLPAVFIYEQDCTACTDLQADGILTPSCTGCMMLPEGIVHHWVDGTDVLAVNTAMHAAMQHAREGNGPVLLEMHIPLSDLDGQYARHNAGVTQSLPDTLSSNDPLIRCQHMLQEQGIWDESWSTQLHARMTAEVEQAMQDALRDTF